MASSKRSGKKRSAGRAKASRKKSKQRKTKEIARKPNRARSAEEMLDPRIQQQLKVYDEGMRYFQQQKFHKAKLAFEKVVGGYGKELADRARVHVSICDQRISRMHNTNLRSPEENYHGGIAMMNLGRWDEARELLEKARKLAPKAEFVYYAMAALDCLTGDADQALKNLKAAIELRPENRYHARNDEDFAFLQEDPRFTELLYPEREAAG